jgi:hypothetical protein
VQDGHLVATPDPSGSGERIIRGGRAAVEAGDINAMIAHDIAFHSFIYAASGNSMIAPSAELHWRFLRRVMGEMTRQHILHVPVLENGELCGIVSIDDVVKYAVEEMDLEKEVLQDSVLLLRTLDNLR